MSICNKNSSFQEKELEILRQAVDRAQEIKGKRIAQAPEVIENYKYC